MGTSIEIGIASVPGQSEAGAQAAMRAARETMVGLESVLSRFIPDNDIDRINRSQGAWVHISPATSRILRRAEKAFAQSDGLFNPFLGSVMESLGYRESFDQMAKELPAGMPLQAADLPSVRTPLVWSQEEPDTVSLAPGAKVDLGGIAKGWIVEQAAAQIEQLGFHDFVVNAGGDMVCRGRNGSNPWRIGIENPLTPDVPACTLAIDSLAIATSGTYRRRWQLGDKAVHHIVDPRTGQPAVTDLISCSVLHRELVEAEWLAKTALIMGERAAASWLAKADVQGWIVITTEGEVKLGGLAG